MKITEKVEKKVEEPGMRLVTNPAEFLRLFQKGWTYPERPIKTNDYVAYRLLQASNPSSFYIEIIDEINRNAEKGIVKAIQEYTHFITNEKYAHVIPMQLLREQMPVAVVNASKDVYRAEVNVIDKDDKKVNVTLVDTGEELWFSVDQVFPPSSELLRYQKLATQCRLANLVPVLGAKGWPEYDYASLLQGTKTSLVCPVSTDRGVLDVCLECDGIDVSMKAIINLRLARLMPLQPYRVQSAAGEGAYPLNDFSNWVGMKIPIFGVKVRTPNQVVLQLDPQSTNQIYDEIINYTSNTPNMDKIPFKKEVGCPCLARFNGPDSADYCRAIIMENLNNRYVLVKYVDYFDFAVVNQSEIAYIPKCLVDKPEGATLCAIAGLTTSKMDAEDMALKLKDLVDEKDIFGRIEVTEYVSENVKNQAKVLVSLSLPLGEDGDEVSFARLFDIPEPPPIQKFVNIMPILSCGIGNWLLDGSSNFFPNVKYSGVLSCADSDKSVWLQLEDDSIKAEKLAKEMTQFYSSCKDLGLCVETALTGTYVAVQNDGDPQWYRGKIMDYMKNLNLYKVLYLDYGNFEYVPLKSFKSLTVYFGKLPCLALQTALPVKLRETADLSKLSDFIIWFCEDGGDKIDVWVRHNSPFNFAWIVKKNGTQLANELVKNGFATEVLFPDMSNLRV